MLFWVTAAVMTAGTLAVLFAPLARKSAAPATGRELALYEAQLEAIAHERGEGRLSDDAARSSEIEVKRRMLALARKQGAAPAVAGAPAGARKAVAVGLALGVPVLALTIYCLGGSPGLPGAPLAARGAERAAAGLPNEADLALIRELAEHMAKSPEDPQGWMLLAGAYLRQGRFDEAASAYANAAARKPDDPEPLLGLGEAQVLAAGGEVDAAAERSFKAALALDAESVRARYFLGLKAAQDGDYAQAIELWTALIADVPESEPWRANLVQLIDEAQKALAAQAAPTAE